jgi:hypothetical protein
MRHRLVCFLLLAVFTRLAAAQTAPTPAAPSELITTITLEDLQHRVQAMGFECTRGKDDSGNLNNFFVFKAEGYKVAVFVPKPSVIELDNIFDDVHPTPATLNAWNSDNRFSRVYLQKDGSVDLEDDLNLSGGVTSDHLEAFITTFRNSVGRWARFVVDHEEKKPVTP